MPRCSENMLGLSYSSVLPATRPELDSSWTQKLCADSCVKADEKAQRVEVQVGGLSKHLQKGKILFSG